MQPVIVAIDLGTTTGWASNPDGVITSGTLTFRPGRFEGGGMRFVRFRTAMSELISQTGATRLYFEEVRNHGVKGKGGKTITPIDAAHLYGGFLAHLTALCEEMRIPYLGVSVGTIKKHATGMGNANKAAMMAAATARGWTFADDNEADALWILDWAKGQE